VDLIVTYWKEGDINCVMNYIYPFYSKKNNVKELKKAKNMNDIGVEDTHNLSLYSKY
jgi:hypothetical protein